MMERAISAFAPNRADPSSQRGLSLIELMIAITIGMLVVAALLALFLNISRGNRELAKANTQIENGRFAIQVLQNDLMHAGFWGELSPPAPTAVVDPCLLFDDWDDTYKANMLGMPGLGFDNDSVPGNCKTVKDAQDNSDILVVRHANTCTAGSANCEGGSDTGPHIQVSSCTSATPPEAAFLIDTVGSGNLKLTNKKCDATGTQRKVVSNIYFVSDNTLVRSAFVNGDYQPAQPLIEGIDALRFEYGIDTNGDGSPDGYSMSPPATLAELGNIVAVKVHVLARSLEATPGYTDSKLYRLGGATINAAYLPAGFKRHVFSTTVRLVNPSGRREVPPPPPSPSGSETSTGSEGTGEATP